MSTFIGIDPGTTGCVAAIDPNGIVHFWDTPTNKIKVGKKERAVYDVPAMLSILRSNFGGLSDVTLLIEELHAMPKNGGCGNFSSGFGYGLWMMALASEGISHQTVQPARWKKALGLKAATKDLTDSAKKAADRVFACQLFPSAADRMNLGKHHGRADSLLIAEYGRRLANGLQL